MRAWLRGVFRETRPILDQGTFTLSAAGLAIAAGMGNHHFLHGALAVTALLIWLGEQGARRPDFGFLYATLVGVLLVD